MPANVKVIHSHEFVRARPDGQAQLEQAEKLHYDLMKEADFLHKS